MGTRLVKVIVSFLKATVMAKFFNQLKAFQFNPKNFRIEEISINRRPLYEKTIFEITKGFPWLSVHQTVERSLNMEINDNEFGGFIVSKNVYIGRPIRYSYREKSSITKLNGWTIYSCDDDQKYVENPDNFIILGASSIYKIAPVMLEIFNAPYGTDICWLYEKDVHIGFYDLKNNKEITIEKILKQ